MIEKKLINYQATLHVIHIVTDTKRFLFFLFFFARQQYRRAALRCGLICQIREMHISRDGKRTRTTTRLSGAGHEVIFSLSSRRKLYALQTSEHPTAELTSFNETVIKRKRDEEGTRDGEGRRQ